MLERAQRRMEGRRDGLRERERVRENQLCTKSWSPFCVAFAPLFPKGNWPFSGTGKPPLLWEVLLRTYYFYRISCMNPLFSSSFKSGAKRDAKWWTSMRCMVESLWEIERERKRTLYHAGGNCRIHDLLGGAWKSRICNAWVIRFALSFLGAPNMGIC